MNPGQTTQEMMPYLQQARAQLSGGGAPQPQAGGYEMPMGGGQMGAGADPYGQWLAQMVNSNLNNQGMYNNFMGMYADHMNPYGDRAYREMQQQELLMQQEEAKRQQDMQMIEMLLSSGDPNSARIGETILQELYPEYYEDTLYPDPYEVETRGYLDSLDRDTMSMDEYKLNYALAYATPEERRAYEEALAQDNNGWWFGTGNDEYELAGQNISGYNDYY